MSQTDLATRPSTRGQTCFWGLSYGGRLCRYCACLHVCCMLVSTGTHGQLRCTCPHSLSKPALLQHLARLKVLLRVQGLRAGSNAGSDIFGKSRLHSDSIRAGQNSPAWLSSLEDLSCTDGKNQSVTLDGVKSLMHAGSWLQMLRAKLAGPSYRQQPGQVC